jgi:hypothetical protein
MGESIAHLHLLWHDGRLSRRLDDDGIYRFSTKVAALAFGETEHANAA